MAMGIFGNIKIQLPFDSIKLSQMTQRFLKDDGKVSKDEAQALLKQAGSDGKISSAELSFLQSKVQKPLFQFPMFEKVGDKLQLRPRQDEFDADAQAEIRKLTQHANATPESNEQTSRSLGDIRDTFLADDGKIDAKEARVLLGEAVSSGKALTQEEVSALRGVMDDARTEQDGKAELNDVLQYVGPKPDPVASVGKAVQDAAEAVAAASKSEP
jgi:hypothetical protein